MTDLALSGSAATSAEPMRLKRAAVLGAAAIALVAGLATAGRPAGHFIALAGYSDDQTLRRVWIGDDRLAVPANMIRHARARTDGSASRLDLYLRWPLMDGFGEEARDDFNNRDGVPRIIFLSFEPRTMSRDMSGRLEPIYRGLLAGRGSVGEDGTTVYDFKPDTGYIGETLVVLPRPDGETLVARCLAGEDAALAPCERDIAVGKGLSLTYRFPRRLLARWDAVETAVRAKAASLLEAR